MLSENNKHRDESSIDHVDEVLHRALRVDIEEQRLERLCRYWQLRSKVYAVRRRSFYAIPLAAATLAIGAFFVEDTGKRHDRSYQQASHQQAIHGDDALPLKSAPVVAIQVETPVLSASRQPTAYESLLFAAQTSRALATKPQSSAAIEEVLHRLTQDSDTSTGEILANSGFSLAELKTGLLQIGQKITLRDHAVEALTKLVGLRGLAELVYHSHDPEMRTALVLRLLADDSSLALIEYLALVEDVTTRVDALAAIKQLPQPPISQLIVLLDDEDKPIRLSAAIALSNLNGPRVTEPLIARVANKPSNSIEAWLALLSCRDDTAEDFLTYAGSRPQLLGYYNNARIRHAQMTP